MSGWRAHLATLRAQPAPAPDTPAPKAIGTIGAIGIEGETATALAEAPAGGRNDAVHLIAADMRRASEAALEALAAPDPDLDHERAEISGARAAEARGDYGAPLPPDEHRKALAGLLRGAGRPLTS